MGSHRLEGETCIVFDILTRSEFEWYENVRLANPCTMLALGSGEKLGHKEACFILKQLKASEK